MLRFKFLKRKHLKMKCLVFSDSHGSSIYMSRAIELHPDAEVVFFLGDGLSDLERIADRYPDRAFIAVRGNCDHTSLFRNSTVEKTDSITLEGVKIVLTHGDLYSAKYGIGGLISLGVRESADIVLFGHTHQPFEKYISDNERPFYLFNPGSISPESASYGVITLRNGILLSHGTFL